VLVLLWHVLTPIVAVLLLDTLRVAARVRAAIPWPWAAAGDTEVDGEAETETGVCGDACGATGEYAAVRQFSDDDADADGNDDEEEVPEHQHEHADYSRYTNPDAADADADAAWSAQSQPEHGPDGPLKREADVEVESGPEDCEGRASDGWVEYSLLDDVDDDWARGPETETVQAAAVAVRR
jgi:hypothetical protein